jgi:transposase
MKEAAMPRPYSADLHERVLLAHEHDEGGAAALARRFRIGVSTLYRWLGEARAGRRAALPMGRGRAPLGGAEDTLRALVAEQNDATLAEYAERFAARTGQRRSLSAICRGLRRLKLPRKKSRSAPPSRTGRTWPRPVRCGTPTSPGSRRIDWSSSMRAASTPVSSEPTPALRAANARSAMCLGSVGV